EQQMNRKAPLLRFSVPDQKCNRKKSGTRHDDNKDENESAPDVLPLRHGSNSLQRSEHDRHPDQTENGEGKGIISGERDRPERMRPQTQPDDRGRDKSKKQPMVRIHLR